MSNVNNNGGNSNGRRGVKRGRGRGQPPPQPAQKKQKRARKARAPRNRAPRINRGPSGDGGIGSKDSFPVTEREYIAEIIPTAFPAFSVQSFPVNPGQAKTFPWLSRIAANFDKYEFDSLAFIYKREVSEFATNGVSGKVIMMFDVDAADPAPNTKQQMEDTLPHKDCMPCENMRMDIPPQLLRRLNDAHFVRPGSQPANTDLKTYDVGTLHVACQGTAANSVVGELHVEYSLRLRTPNLVDDSAVGTLRGAGGSLAAATPMGAAPVATGSIILAAAATNVLSITGVNVGQEIQVTQLITGTAITAMTFGTLVGLTVKSGNAAGFSAAATTGINDNTFIVTAQNPTLVMNVTASDVATSRVTVTAIAPIPGF